MTSCPSVPAKAPVPTNTTSYYCPCKQNLKKYEKTLTQSFNNGFNNSLLVETISKQFLKPYFYKDFTMIFMEQW